MEAAAAAAPEPMEVADEVAAAPEAPKPAAAATPAVEEAADKALPTSEGRVKRERKQVERLTLETKKEEEFAIPEVRPRPGGAPMARLRLWC